MSDLLFSSKHFVALVYAIVFIALLLYIFIHAKGTSKHHMMVAGVLFYGFELIKTIYYIFTTGYKISMLPLYLCNIPLFVLWIPMFLNEHKLNQYFKPIIYVIFIGGGLGALFYPSIILGTTETWSLTLSNLIPFISITGHSIMVVVGLYMVISSYYIPTSSDGTKIISFVLLIGFLIYIFNTIFDTNFFFLNKNNGLPFIAFIFEISHLMYSVTVLLLTSLYLFIIFFITYKIKKR